LRPLEINTSNLNLSPFTGIDEAALQLEFEDLKTKDLWNSKFTLLTAELEDLERQHLHLHTKSTLADKIYSCRQNLPLQTKSTIAMQHKWSETDNLKKQDQVVF